MQSINPYDESVLATYEFHTRDDVLGAHLNRRRGNWRHIVYRRGPIEVRKQRLLLAAKIFRERADQLAVMMTQEMGKPIDQSKAEVEKSAACCEYYAEHAEQMLQPQVVQTEASCSEIHFQPMGTILAIMPWNFPVWQVVRCAAPALMAGNRILLKHALNVCGCAEMIQAVFDDSFGEMAVCNIRVPHEDAASLIQTHHVQAVTLTGSERAGSEVGKVAGEAIIKCVMELGGVDPFIVLEDADIETTVAAAVRSRILNNGQSCIAAKRFILMKSIADEFTECFVEQMKQLKMGDPMDPETELGPLARKDLRDALHEQVIFRTERLHGTLLCGGVIPDRSGWFYPPTVISQTYVDTDNHIRETFGPVAMIEVNQDDRVPMSHVTHSEYGLGASIWTQDIDRARKVASGLRCGSVFVNEITKSDPRLPFGGVGRSGYGRELSEFGLREFTNIKTIWIK